MKVSKQAIKQKVMISINKPSNRLILQEASQKLKKLILKKQSQKENSPIQIADHLWLGNYSFASDHKFMEQNRISLVVSCLQVPPTQKYEGITYQSIPIKDQQWSPIQNYYDQAFQWIQKGLQTDKGVYVHCFSGKSRSVAIALSYIMKKQRLTYHNAFERILQKIPNAKPNSGFVKKLQLLERQLEEQRMSKQELEKLQSEQNELLKRNKQICDSLEGVVLPLSYQAKDKIQRKPQQQTIDLIDLNQQVQQNKLGKQVEQNKVDQQLQQNQLAANHHPVQMPQNNQQPINQQSTKYKEENNKHLQQSNPLQNEVLQNKHKTAFQYEQSQKVQDWPQPIVDISTIKSQQDQKKTEVTTQTNVKIVDQVKVHQVKQTQQTKQQTKQQIQQESIADNSSIQNACDQIKTEQKTAQNQAIRKQSQQSQKQENNENAKKDSQGQNKEESKQKKKKNRKKKR